MLELKNIAKSFYSGNDNWTFGPVDLEVKRGEFLGVLGKSGSGKSTLLHIAGGLISPDRGDVFWNEESLYALKDRHLTDFRNRKMGFVFQDFYLLKEFDLYTNVAMPLLLRGSYSKKEIAEKVAFVLALTELETLGKRLPHELSGGQKQRVAIARAFVHNPEIVFADEPTGSLDEQSALGVIELLEKLNKEQNTTLICVTHDEKVAQRAKRIVKIVNGKVSI